MSQPIDPSHFYHLRAGIFSEAPIAVDHDDLERIARAHLGDSLDDFVELIVAERIVPVSPLARVRVIDDALTAVHIEVSDGPARGRRGWVPNVWLNLAERQREADASFAAAAASAA